LKKGDFAYENSAMTGSNIEETLKRLVTQLKKTPQEVFDALMNQTMDLVLIANPTQSIHKSLLQKHGRYICYITLTNICYIMKDGTEYAEKNGMFFIETSTKTADNINELFEVRLVFAFFLY